MAGPDRHPINIVLGAGTPIAAGTSQEVIWTCPFPGNWQIKNMYLSPDDTATEHATNITVLTLKRGSTTLFSHDTTTTTGEGTLTAKTPIAQTDPSGADAIIAQGETLVFGKADAASGVAFSGSVQLEIVQV